MSLINLIQFNSLGDERGSLVALEAHKDIPFDIQRVYYMHGMQQDISRGFHAHKELQQVAVCIKGSCKFIMDDGRNRKEKIIKESTTGILIDKMIWHEMHDFSSDCVLMVVASDAYDESDYIRDYKNFINLVEEK